MTYSGGVTQRLLDINQFKRRINRNDPVANIYRNAIDLNRYSNAVANQVVTAYNDVILSAVDDLRRIDIGAATAGGGIVSPASYQAQRLRVILAQLQESLGTWAGTSTALVSSELQGLAELQTQFVTEQMRLAIRGGIADARELLPSQIDALQMVRTVQVAPNFAATVVSVDPTAINFTLPGTGAFNLTAGQGAAMTLPNGQVVEKAFRGLAESQAQMFNTMVRNGLLTGEPTQQIARRLVGNLDFGQQAMSVRQRAQAGGQLTKMADHQVMAIVRTSVQDVSNQASQQVYQANQDITNKYRYLATLDSRTSAICRSLDGQEFKYEEGPTPPIHFNCRSTTIPIIDYKALKIPPPDWGTGPSSRASADGQVPGSIRVDGKETFNSYGYWLKSQPKAYQAEVLGPTRAAYFNKISEKVGPRDALARMVREDGSEVTLKQLQQRYGNP
jgi:SPP1 gp7 family putative phage head morphogenesis protein